MQIQKFRKRKSKLLNSIENNVQSEIRHHPYLIRNEKMNNQTCEWFSRLIIITSASLQEKALDFAKRLNKLEVKGTAY